MKKLYRFFLLAVLSALLGLTALAAQQEFHYLESQRDVVISVTWTDAQPSVKFIAPDGTVFDPLEESDRTRTTIGDGAMLYVIFDAPAGQWSVDLEKRGTEQVAISMFDYLPAPEITAFTVGAAEDGRVQADFTVTMDEDYSYDYRIGAVISPGGDEIELTTGSASANRAVSRTVYLDDLRAYDAWMLKLTVTRTVDGTDCEDVAYSSPFAWVPDDAEDAPEFTLTVEPEEYLAYAAWDGLPWSAEQVLVALFEDDAEEPAYFDTFDPRDGEATLGFDPAAGTIRVEVTVQSGGVYGRTAAKTVDLAASGLLIEDAEAVNRLRLGMDYVGMSGTLATVRVGENETELSLDGSGTVSIVLADGWNDISAWYTDADGVIWRYARSVFVDRTAPTLTMAEAYDGMTTALDTLTLVGAAPDAASVTVGGEAIELGASGGFSADDQLDFGENAVTVTAADALGNEAVYTAVITRTGGPAAPAADPGSDAGSAGSGGSWLHYLPMLVCAALGLMLVAYALIFWRRKKEGDAQ